LSSEVITLGDGIDGMLALEAGSVDLVLTDLPSGETVAKFDKPVSLPKFFEASWHCLKPSGVICVMASSLKFAAKLMDHGGQTYRYDYVWHKSQATGFFNAHLRPLRAHEYFLVFYRQQPVFNPQMVETGIPINSNSTRGRSHGENYGVNSDSGIARAGATDRFPRSVLSDKCVGTRSKNRKHPQQKPDSLFETMVLTYTDPGELVVDPCAGSGTTARAAEKHGRLYRCWDLSERFGK
jgi:site-specific DNA-methyltransferase (adenine-specific)